MNHYLKCVNDPSSIYVAKVGNIIEIIYFTTMNNNNFRYVEHNHCLIIIINK